MKKIGLIVALLMSSVAFAGVTIHDRAGVMTTAQQSSLVANGNRWPFDLHVVTGAFPNPNVMNTTVDHCVTGPNVVCIGVDPVHHKTVVRAGAAVGLPSDNSIAAAGNSYFRVGDYQGGIEAIASRARELAHTVVNTPHNTVVTTPYIQQPQVQVHIDNPVPTGMTTGWWLFLFGMIALAGIVIYYVVRAVKTTKKINEDMNDFRDEAFEMSSRNLEERDFHEKLKAKMPVTTTKVVTPTTQTVVQTVPVSGQGGQVVIPTAPAGVAPSTTVVHNHYGNTGSNSTLTGSVMTDVMLAEALTRPSTPVVAPAPVVVEREVVRETHSDSGSSSSWNNDDGGNSNSGSSSSWGSSDNDSSSGSSSSWDSGSSSSSDSSSSWDSGSSSSWDSGSSGGGWDGGSSGGGGDSGW